MVLIVFKLVWTKNRLPVSQSEIKQIYNLINRLKFSFYSKSPRQASCLSPLLLSPYFLFYYHYQNHFLNRVSISHKSLVSYYTIPNSATGYQHPTCLISLTSRHLNHRPNRFRHQLCNWNAFLVRFLKHLWWRRYNSRIRKYKSRRFIFKNIFASCSS